MHSFDSLADADREARALAAELVRPNERLIRLTPRLPR